MHGIPVFFTFAKMLSLPAYGISLEQWNRSQAQCKRSWEQRGRTLGQHKGSVEQHERPLEQEQSALEQGRSAQARDKRVAWSWSHGDRILFWHSGALVLEILLRLQGTAELTPGIAYLAPGN